MQVGELNGVGKLRGGERASSPSAFPPAGAAPSPITPLSLRSRYQLLVWPWALVRVKAKMALPFLMASWRSASSDLRAAFITSKAAEAGNAAEQLRAHVSELTWLGLCVRRGIGWGMNGCHGSGICGA